MTKQLTQNLKVDGKKRKIHSFEINQDLSIYQSLSKKPRKMLSQKNSDINHDVQSAMFPKSAKFLTSVVGLPMSVSP